MPNIFVLMGKSATGKDTIFQTIVKKGVCDLKTIITYTTRPIRKGETEGIEYHFVTQEQFMKWEREHKIIEKRSYQTVYGIWNYFTVDDGQINLSCYNYIMIGTLETYKQMREYFGEDKIYPIYIEVEDGLRLFRALSRERAQIKPKYRELCRRFLADADDFSEENLERLSIEKRFYNENLDNCMKEIVEEIHHIITITE